MPYIESTMDEFLEAANESLIGHKRSVNELLASAEKKLNKNLKTTGDCDDQLLMVNNEARKFNECIKALAKVKKEYDEGKLNDKQFKEQVKNANFLLKKNCRILQVQLGNVIDDTKAVSKEELEDFKAYIEGLRRIIKSRKSKLAKEAKSEAKESTLTFVMSALEGDFDIAELEKEEAEKMKKKSKDDEDEDDDKDDKKKEDTSEDDFDGESLDDDSDDDDKKSKKKKSKDKDDDDDEDDDKKSKDKDDDDDEDDDKKSKDKDDDDEDDDKDKKDGKKKSKDDDSDLDDFDFDDDSDDDDKKSKKKKSKDEDDDDDDEDEDDDKKSKDKDDDDSDDDDKKSKKKKSKDKDDEDDDDEDEDDDKKEAKEAVYNHALEIMSNHDCTLEEAIQLSALDLGYKANIIDAATEYANGFGTALATGMLLGGSMNYNYNIDPEMYDRNFVAEIKNLIATYNALPAGSASQKGYGEKIAKKIKSPQAAMALQKYGVWDDIPAELKVYYNAKAQKKAAKIGRKFEKKQAKKGAKIGNLPLSNSEKPDPKNRERYVQYTAFARKHGFATPEEMHLAYKKNGIVVSS